MKTFLMVKGVSWPAIFLMVFDAILVTMKNWIVVILMVAGNSLANGQVVARLFYNEKWLLTKKDSAVYFRVVVLDTASQQFVGEVKDFTKDGKPMMTGSFAGGERNGQFVSYYPNGAKESEGAYANDVRIGAWQYYFDNGGLKYKANFEKKVPSADESRDVSGAVVLKDGTGLWEEHYPEIWTGVDIVIKGKFTNYRPDGTWTQSLPDGTIWSEEVFKAGEFVSGYVIADSMRIELIRPSIEILHEDPKHRTTRQFGYTKNVTSKDYPYIKRLYVNKDQGEVFSIVEVMSRPIGGMAAFYNAVSSLLRYPKEARRKGVEGRVFVEFIVERNGSLTNIKAIKGIGAGCDEEAVRVVRESQNKVKWLPGVQGRKRVRQRYTLPVNFR